MQKVQVDSRLLLYRYMWFHSKIRFTTAAFIMNYVVCDNQFLCDTLRTATKYRTNSKGKKRERRMGVGRQREADDERRVP